MKIDELARASAGHDLTLTRVIDAPRALVWRAWTDPDRLAMWWGPRGFTSPVCRIEARPGGAWHIDMQAPDGTVYPCRGTYVEVVEPERLVYTDVVDPNDPAWAGAPPPSCVHVIEFEDLGRKTRLTVTMRMATAAEREATARSGAMESWAEILDRLAAVMAGAREAE
jgi:uncharacterized protein YndB with AHSA1/START domain